MGYESRIFFVQDSGYSISEDGINLSMVIAQIDMCKLGHNEYANRFYDCFDTETPFSIRHNGEDVIEDEYGTRLVYASDKQKLYNAILEMQEHDCYWRLPILADMIKNFKDYENVYIVHYGY